MDVDAFRLGLRQLRRPQLLAGLRVEGHHLLAALGRVDPPVPDRDAVGPDLEEVVGPRPADLPGLQVDRADVALQILDVDGVAHDDGRGRRVPVGGGAREWHRPRDLSRSMFAGVISESARAREFA